LAAISGTARRSDNRHPGQLRVAQPGGRHDGDLADVGATVRRWLGDRGAGGDAEVPGAPIPLGG